MKFLENTTKVQPKNLQNGFQSIYQFSRFVGLWPFTFTYNSNGSIGEARVRLFDSLWFSISICLYLTAVFYTYDDLKNVQNADYYLSDMLFYLSQIPPLLFGAVGIVLDMLNRNRLANILDKFWIFDGEISNFGISFDYKNENRRAFCYLMIPTLITLPMLIVTIFAYQSDWSTSLIFLRWAGPQLLRSIACISVSISFAIFIRSLCIRLFALNSLLRNRFLTGNRLKVLVEMYKKDSIDVIKFVGRQHAFLTDITDLLNVCYSFQILISTTAAFTYAILTTYGFCQLMIHVEKVPVSLSIAHLGWLILYMCVIIIIIYYSNSLTNEGKRTARIVHDIVNCCDDSDMILSLGQLSQQTQLRYPIISCGLFTFDWLLLFNMTAAIATYLIIVLNFEISAKKN